MQQTTQRGLDIPSDSDFNLAVIYITKTIYCWIKYINQSLKIFVPSSKPCQKSSTVQLKKLFKMPAWSRYKRNCHKMGFRVVSTSGYWYFFRPFTKSLNTLHNLKLRPRYNNLMKELVHTEPSFTQSLGTSLYRGLTSIRSFIKTLSGKRRNLPLNGFL